MADLGNPSWLDLMAGDQPTAMEQARAMAQRLRQKQAMAEAISTVPALAGTAKLMGQDVGDQDKLAMQSGTSRLHYGNEALALKQALENARNQTALTREMLRGNTALEVQKLKNLLTQAAQGRGQVAIGPDGNFVIINKTTSTSTPVTAPGGEVPLRQGKALEPDVQKMAADAQFLSQMPNDIALLKGYVGKDRPGGGPLSGRLPDWALGEEANAQRQAAQRIMNAIIYMSTGKQINEQEAKRLLLARGIGPTSSQSAFDAGMKSLETELRKAAQVYKAKYRPEVISALKERGGTDWLEGLLGGESAAPVPTTDLRKKYGLE